MDSIKNLNQSEQNIRLVNLACDCMFIFASKKEELIKRLEEESKENPNIDVLDIFRQDELVSDERIDYLLDFTAHLETQSQDQQFGKLAVANGMVSEENVTQALKYQKSCFEKNQINMKIGEILVENRLITTTDQLTILLTQNRIKNEQLLDAFNEMGETQPQKDDINKRFAAFAIKNERVTTDQVIEALKLQKDERTEKGSSRFIGEILRETVEMSDNDIQEILVQQKQFEKRRLDLEKALYTAQAELKIYKKLSSHFYYSLSKDGIEGFAKKIKAIDTEIPCYEFLIWLRRVGITFGIVSDDVLEDFIRNAELNVQITVAKGYPPVQCVDESVKFYFGNESEPVIEEPDNTDSEEADPPEPGKTEPDQDESKQDNPPEKEDTVEKGKDADEKNQEDEGPEKENEPDIPNIKGDQAPLLIHKGCIVARIIPGREGRPGKTVLGNPIQPAKPSIFTLNAGSGVIRKGPDFFARIDGLPALKNETNLVVEPVVKKTVLKTIRGNISNDTETTYESAAVTLSGTITPEAVLRCDSLDLKGALLGRVICTGDIQINGDIGKSGGNTEITCHGSIRVSKAVNDSKIQTGGELLAFNSTVTGSEITAYDGMTIKDVVKGEHGPAVLRFGLKPWDNLLTLDHTISQKNDELSVLKKESEILELTETYQKDVNEIETHLCEQLVLNTLACIIEAPELYQYEGLEGKLTYLYNLPDFSSVKTFYLKLPETDIAEDFLKQIITATEKMDIDHVLKHIKKKMDPMDPESEDKKSDTGESEESAEPVMSEMERIEREFKLRLDALEAEVEDNEEEIQKIENEIKGLKALRAQDESSHITFLSQSTAAVKIKNQCEKGTVIKGIIARMIVPETVYHVKFEEILNPGTQTPSIVIETY